MNLVKVTEKTDYATIYVGRLVRDTGTELSLSLARNFLKSYCNAVGLCVTLTETEYIYSNGGEPGFSVGLINYPRFPSTPEKIRTQALEIAKGLKELYMQYKVTVVFPDVTIMLSTEPGN